MKIWLGFKDIDNAALIQSRSRVPSKLCKIRKSQLRTIACYIMIMLGDSANTIIARLYVRTRA